MPYVCSFCCNYTLHPNVGSLGSAPLAALFSPLSLCYTQTPFSFELIPPLMMPGTWKTNDPVTQTQNKERSRYWASPSSSFFFVMICLLACRWADIRGDVPKRTLSCLCVGNRKINIKLPLLLNAQLFIRWSDKWNRSEAGGPVPNRSLRRRCTFYSYSCLVTLENSAPVGRHSTPGFIKIADDSV